jgi:hypothetical protein
MSSDMRRAPEKLWLLFDMSNGHHPAKNYVWWHTSRVKALEQKRHHKERGLTDLAGPVLYRVDPRRPRPKRLK